jgi:hypothetical protein
LPGFPSIEEAIAMNDSEKLTNRAADVPIELPRRKAAPAESEEYADAVSEGWPVSPHPRNPTSEEVR